MSKKHELLILAAISLIPAIVVGSVSLTVEVVKKISRKLNPLEKNNSGNNTGK